MYEDDYEDEYDGPPVATYRRWQRELHQYQCMDPLDPERPEWEEIEALQAAIDGCF